MSTPAQSLTSLDWYRQSLDESGNGRRGVWVRWFRGPSFLLFHVSLYVISIVFLFAIDLIRSPASFWIENLAFAWAALIVVHAAIAGLIWAIGLLKEDRPSEKHDLQWSSTSTTGGWGEKREEPQDANFRMSAPHSDDKAIRTNVPPMHSAPISTTNDTPAAQPPQSWSSIDQSSVAASPPVPASVPAPASAAGHASPWSGWEPASAAAIARQALEGTTSGERASWTEASDAAWLTHASDSPSPDSDTFKQQFRGRRERRRADRSKTAKAFDEEDSGPPPR
ncbi:MAG: hypothetical protein ACR2OU_12885 [Thermomicrobiales bacterium]